VSGSLLRCCTWNWHGLHDFEVCVNWVSIYVEVSFFGVTRTIQKRDGIVHVIAESFWDPQTLLGAKPASSGSRDFH